MGAGRRGRPDRGDRTGGGRRLRRRLAWSRPCWPPGSMPTASTPPTSVLEPALDRGLDVRAESVLDHLDVVADEALAGHRAERLGPVAPTQRAGAAGGARRVPPGRRRGPGAPLGHPRVVDGGEIPPGQRTWLPGGRSTRRPGATCWPAGVRTGLRSPGRRRAAAGPGGDRRTRTPAAINAAIDAVNALAARVGRVPSGRRTGAVTAVHQFVPALLPRDATGDHTLALRDTLRRGAGSRTSTSRRPTTSSSTRPPTSSGTRSGPGPGTSCSTSWAPRPRWPSSC